MNLRDRNLRFALLKAITDAIKTELDLERGDHTQDLKARYDDEGVKSMDVKLPGGGKVATISLSIPKPSTEVVDEEALLAWCQANMPTAIKEHTVPAEPERVIPATPEHTVYTVDQSMLDAMLKGARPVDPTSSILVDEDGTVIEGIEHVPGGPPKSFSVRYEKDGREDLAVAYRSGELDHLVAGSTLPALEARQAIPVEPVERGDHSGCQPGGCEAPDFQLHIAGDGSADYDWGVTMPLLFEGEGA